jgi:hypothetical protein
MPKDDGPVADVQSRRWLGFGRCASKMHDGQVVGTVLRYSKPVSPSSLRNSLSVRSRHGLSRRLETRRRSHPLADPLECAQYQCQYTHC